METSIIKINKLKGSRDFEVWALRMEAFLTEKDYHDVMVDPTPPEVKKDDPESQKAFEAYWAKRNIRSTKACALIRLTLDDGPLIQTRGITDALTLWNRLLGLYQSRGFSSEFLICKELFNTTLARCNNSIESYLTKIKRLTDELAARNLAIPNKVIAAYTLNNLTADYEYTVAIISQTIRSTNLDVDLNLLFAQLLDESRRLKSRGDVEMAMPIQGGGASNKANKPNTKPKCNHCKKTGHKEDKCWVKNPDLKPQGNNNPKGKDQEKDKAKEKAKKDAHEEELSFISQDIALSTTQEPNQTIWHLDSGATRHICAYKSLFYRLEPCDVTLSWGKAGSIKVSWMGDIKVKFSSTKQEVTISNCLYAPELGINLLSQGQLINKGVTILATAAGCTLSLKDTTIATGVYKNNLTLFYTYQEETAMPALENRVWHERMGHIGYNALKALPEATIGVPPLKEPLEKSKDCEVCIQAKAKAKISREPATKSTKYLDKVYSDICGPITPLTWSKAKYIATFIDDRTKWAEIALLRSRDELFSEFTKWLNRAENQSGLKLKRFHSDNAPEYKTPFNELYAEKGIIGTYTAPYTPAQNGGAEIFNRTLISKARALLFHSGLPKAYWGEAVNASTYLYNRTPHSSLPGFITPYEAKTGKKPDISNVRTWGSIAYKKDSTPGLKKLEPRAQLFLLMGYGSN